MPAYRFGDIVEADIPDPDGNFKPRPVIIITPDAEIAAASSLSVVAISTSPARGAVPESYFELPAKLTVKGKGHTVTGLKLKCWAKCDWRVDVPKEDILYSRGTVPASILKRISEYLAKADS
ncbi:MAG: type II toxin-antitoxin system PemK/MazF family toxin [Planctomycetaceae bacterium]|nr:type II toxin-antitoxin system PemK/MazF family toxin [Planctomycetaceae bacterium]